MRIRKDGDYAVDWVMIRGGLDGDCGIDWMGMVEWSGRLLIGWGLEGLWKWI